MNPQFLLKRKLGIGNDHQVFIIGNVLFKIDEKIKL